MRDSRDNRPDRGRGDRFTRRDSGSPTMFQATCASCGNACEVPFKPRGDRPVYCSNCFDKQGDRDSRHGGGRDDRRSSFGDKQMFPATCDNCGNSCEVPFRPSGDKPVYCKNCFNKMGAGKDRVSKNFGQGGTQQPDEQLSKLNAKLDLILSILKPGSTKASAPKADVVITKKADKVPTDSTSKPKAKIAKPKKRPKK